MNRHIFLKIILIIIIIYYINIDEIYTAILNKNLYTMNLKHCKTNKTGGCIKNFYYLEEENKEDDFQLMKTPVQTKSERIFDPESGIEDPGYGIQKILEKPAFILFYGFMGRKELIQFHLVWRELLPVISKYYNIYVIDLPGFGESKMLKENSIKNVAEYVSEFIKEKKLKDVVICGRSFGGAVSLYLSIHNPEIKKAIIFNPYYGKGILNTKGMQKWKNKKKLKSYHVGPKRDEDIQYININKYYFKFLTYLYDIKHRNDWYKIYIEVTNKEEITDEQIKNIKIPVLLIYGKCDEYFYNNYLLHLEKLLLSSDNKNKMILELEGEGHSSYLNSTHTISKNKIEEYIKIFLSI
jgi:pimeloyl-ACP methyl ester carboxylesterase